LKLKTLALILVSAVLAHAGTVTGRVVNGAGTGIANATVSFTPSQAGYITGVGAVSQTPNYCYTTTDGSFVGLPNPLVAPGASTNYASGTLPAGTYYVVIGYWVSSTVTLYSPELTVVMASPGTLTVNAPTLQPTGATGYKVYIGTVSGAETLQATVTGWGTSAQSTTLAAGTALPSSNTTACTFNFNDTIIPSYTTYFTDIVDASGNHVPGFPQNFYFAGSTVALDTLTPAVNLVAKFPTAIIASPSGSVQQSINGPLTLNGFQLTAGIVYTTSYDQFDLVAAPLAPVTGKLRTYAKTGTSQFCAKDSTGTEKCLIGTADVGIVNVVKDCGLVANNSTDNLAAMVTCLATYKSANYFFPACGFNPQGGGTANVACYFFSAGFTLSYNGSSLTGPVPSVWNGLVSLRFPTNTRGVRFDTNCYGCRIANLGLIGPDTWSSSATSYASWPDWTPATLVGDGADGLQLLGGSPIVENVAIYGFGRHGIFADGASGIASPAQPDAFYLNNVMLDGNRANGFFSIGCDSNVGVAIKLKTRGNMLAGIYDYSCLGNTWLEPDSALDGRSAISAGATSNIATIGDNGATVLTITTATPVAGWTATSWITVAGTVNYNGTYKVTGGTSSNFTLNYLGAPQVAEVVGTAQQASSTSVFATLTARAAGAGQAPTIECAFSSRPGSSNQVWINPYQESNSAPPCWQTGTLVVGGQLASTVKQATGQGFTWIQNNGGGLLVNGGQAFTLKQPADSLTTFNLQAGATARQNIALKFLSFDGSVNETIQSTSAGALTFTDTTCLWMQKTEGGTLLLRGCSTNEDLTFNQSSGRDTLFYCGSASVCGKFLKSDSGFYVLNAIRPFTAAGTDVGTAALPFAKVYFGTAATNNFVLTPAATAAARTLAINDPLANSTLRTEISGNTTVDLASVATAACSADSSAVTVTGARVGDAAIVTAATALEAGGFLIGRVTANDAAKFQFCNLSGGNIDRASDTYTIRVSK
jgi:hypothetical protein